MATLRVTSAFTDLLTKQHRKIITDEYKRLEPIYVKYFDVETVETQTVTVPRVTGVGIWSSNTEGSAINMSDFVQGDKASFTMVRYDNGYTISHELMEDDQYRVMKGFGTNGSAKKLGQGLREREETVAAGVLSGGFANTGYDGVSLYNAAHPLANSASTVANLVSGNPVLSDASLKAAIILMADQLDEAGNKTRMTPKVLVVPPALQFTANAILNSLLQSGTANNDTNTLPTMKIVVNPYLSTNTEWHVIDTDYENLKFYWREKPTFWSEMIPGTWDMRMMGAARFTAGYVDFRGLVASNGTAV